MAKTPSLWTKAALFSALLLAACSSEPEAPQQDPADLPNGADMAQGIALAEMWCKACHAKVGRVDLPHPDAPDLDDLAWLAKNDPEAFLITLTEPHPAMEDVDLTEAERDALLLYFRVNADKPLPGRSE